MNRLVWYVEHDSILTNKQNGFRNYRTTQNHLIRLKSFIWEGFIKKEHVVSIFFYMEKAYDIPWKHGVLKDLNKIRLLGIFLTAYLSDHLFRVRLSTLFS